MTLSYANGNGYQNQMDENGRLNLTTVDTTDSRFRFPAMVQLSTETHAGEDVAVFASGPWSHLFTGTYEQHLIPYMMAYASCIGNDDIMKACD